MNCGRRHLIWPVEVIPPLPTAPRYLAAEESVGEIRSGVGDVRQKKWEVTQYK